MGQFFQFFDLWDPASEDMAFSQDGAHIAVESLFTDMHTWGILRSNAYPASLVIPVSSISPVPPTRPNIAAAPVTLNTQNGLVSVGTGSNSSANPPTSGLVAYDINGQRISIQNDAYFNFGTSGPYGVQSSGNISIPLNLSGTSGGSNTNSSVPGVYYLWITHLETNGSQQVVDQQGAIHYPEMFDGYQIQITGTNVAPQGDGISIFLAKVTWAGGPAGSLTASTANVYDGNGNAVEIAPATVGDPHRVWMGVRPQYVEIYVDGVNKTATYGAGYLGSLMDHINAIGSAAPSASNPHGIALSNIPGAGAEPIAIANQMASLADGLVDKNAPQNSPAILGTAAQPFIEHTSLAPTATLDPVATAAGISTTIQDKWVRITCFTDAATPLLQAAFSNGNELLALYPNLRQTNLSQDASITTNPNSGDGWVGFNRLSDVSGMYLISGKIATLSTGQNVLLLTKTLMPGWPASTYTLAPGQIAIAALYWNSDIQNAYNDPDLYRNPVLPNIGDAPNVVSFEIDQRDLGLVGPQQLSTSLKADPNVGAFSQEAFNNLVANSNYLFGANGLTEVSMGASTYVVSQGYQLYAGSGPSGGSAIQDATLLTGGPSAISGRQWQINAGSIGSLTNSLIFQELANIKPSKIYGISFWYKTNQGMNARFQIGMSSSNTTTLQNLITLDGVSAYAPLDFTLLTDGNWHRGSILLQTLPGVNADPAALKYLVFQLQQGGLNTTAGFISLTNVSVTEGEWIPGYQAGRTIPNHGIVFFDDLTTCPEGFVEVTSMAGMIAVGRTTSPNPITPGSKGSAPVLDNTGTLSVNTGTTQGTNTAVVGSFNGSSFTPVIAYAHEVTQGGGSNIPNSSIVALDSDGFNGQSVVIKPFTTPGSVPFYGLLPCKAL